MAITGTSYSDWMRQNPQLVQAAQDRMGTPAPAAAAASVPKPAAPPAQAPAQPPAQATQPVQAAPVQPAPVKAPPAVQVGSGAQGGTATEAKDKGSEGAMNMAKTIASFYTGGAAGGIMGAAGGSSDNRVTATMEPGAQQQASSGGGLGQILGLVSMFKGGKGGK